jgi:hypothetical protein
MVDLFDQRTNSVSGSEKHPCGRVTDRPLPASEAHGKTSQSFPSQDYICLDHYLDEIKGDMPAKIEIPQNRHFSAQQLLSALVFSLNAENTSDRLKKPSPLCGSDPRVAPWSASQQ